MILEQITVRSFGLLRNYQETFSQGVNIIEGANETGKSTLAAFIRYMLYGFGEEGGVLSERERRINWVTGTADGSMTLHTQDGKRYRIDRKTERVGNGSTASYIESCEMYDLETDERVTLVASPGETLLGVDKSLYEATAFLGQLSDGSENAADMRQSIENLMFSGDESVNIPRAIAALGEERDRLLSPDQTQGKLVEVRNRATALYTRLSQAVTGQRTLIQKKQELDDAILRRDEAARYRDGLKELRICYQNHQILSSFEQLAAMRVQAQDIAAEASTWRESNTYVSFFPDEAYAADLSVKRRLFTDARTRHEEAESRLRELEAKQVVTRETHKNLQRADKYGGEERVLARHAALQGKFRLFLSISLSLVAAFLLLAVLGGVHFFTADTRGPLFWLWIFATGGAFVGGLVMTLLTVSRHETVKEFCLDYGAESGKDLIYRMKNVTECRNASAAHLQDLAAARDISDGTRAAYFSARNVLDEVLGRWGKTLPPTGSADEFLDVFEGSCRDVIATYRSLCDRKAALDAAIEAFSQTLAAYREEDVRALVSEERRAALSETTPEKIEEGIAYYEEQYAFFAQTVTALEAEMAAMKELVEVPAELSEQLSCAREELDRLTERHRALETALAALSGADIRLRAELSPRLAHYARELMSVMTGGKYDAMTVTDALELQVNSEGEERSVDILSGGTREIAYITLRLALVRLLYRETPPLCFDESFAHQDNDRCYSMLKVFMTLAERNGMQTFLLTCRSREYTVAKEIGGECRLIQMI